MTLVEYIGRNKRQIRCFLSVILCVSGVFCALIAFYLEKNTGSEWVWIYMLSMVLMILAIALAAKNRIRY